MKLRITPIHRDEANAFVTQHRRHYGPLPGSKFCLAVSDEGGHVRGVVLEVTRCCDGAHNACTMLYGVAWRVAKALGYTKAHHVHNSSEKEAPACPQRAGILSGDAGAATGARWPGRALTPAPCCAGRS